jgi:hypothetical protein
MWRLKVEDKAGASASPHYSLATSAFTPLSPHSHPHGASARAIVRALTSLSSTSAFLSPLFYNIQNNTRKLFYSTKIVTDYIIINKIA